MAGEYSVQVGFGHLGLGVFSCHITNNINQGIRKIALLKQQYWLVTKFK